MHPAHNFFTAVIYIPSHLSYYPTFTPQLQLPRSITHKHNKTYQEKKRFQYNYGTERLMSINHKIPFSHFSNSTSSHRSTTQQVSRHPQSSRIFTNHHTPAHTMRTNNHELTPSPTSLFPGSSSTRYHPHQLH